MTEKRFNVFDVGETIFLEDHKEGSYHIGEKENVDIPCLNDIADRLNTYAEENEQLKHNNKMLSMKMSEVSTKYRLLKEFSDDTNPNEAVKTVLHELMMITKEYR